MSTAKDSRKKHQEARRDARAELTTTKVSRRRASQVAAIAKLEGCTVDEAWESLAGDRIDERLRRALAAQTA